MSNYLLDSNIWLAYLLGDSRVDKSVIETGLYHTAEISLAEIMDKLVKEGLSQRQLDDTLQLIISKTNLIQTHYTDYAAAAILKVKVRKESGKNKFSLIDAILLQIAIREKLQILTLDNDFRGITNATVIS